MQAESTVEFVEKWQMGAVLLLSSAFVGFLTGSALGRGFPSDLGLPGFVGGATLTFLALSSLLYGR
ncbi:hypothetical protein [Halobacterium bonnevillei]|uniref:DUF8144 domain-containing protein n=1 Tax=Halobacterium bonnevillei TaxID=2692200 RepID=A0A6B0SSX9_9EURY|nr:hypothetical protein [Halobacterium bonnevillei]MXR22142.1 hypothetical protein [Halobacterium bonnevillei]